MQYGQSKFAKHAVEPMVTIDKFEIKDQDEVKRFVLTIQNQEFQLGFGEMDQPDLLDTEGFYAGGRFWVAKTEQEIVGTIGLQYIDNQNFVLRKMFVKKELRGPVLNIAQTLFDTLLAFAKTQKITTIWLDTPAVATASHKFYARNGFQLSDKTSLPKGYTFPDKNSLIYKLIVG